MSNPHWHATRFVHTFDGWQMWDVEKQTWIDPDFDDLAIQAAFSFFISCQMAKLRERE